MAIKRCAASIDVVRAAEIRLKNVFRNGLPVYMSFSGGKDSLCLAQLVANLAQRGEIDMNLLTVQFVDEEAIFPCIEEMVKNWRRKFLMLGAKFEWYCVEVRHYNCFNELANDESFICWDREKESVWVRRPPAFAIRTHPLLRPRVDTYQDFMPRICRGGITITGVRAAESIQRLQNMASITMAGKKITNKQQILPIYDWMNNDVWLYLLNENVQIPNIYLYLWQAGVSKGQLRVSQFFSIDTARSLVKMNEYYPDLMEQVIRREPNAYLAALYWDTEMFGRHTATRKQLETEESPKDYKALLLEMFGNMDNYFHTPNKRRIAARYKSFFTQCSAIMTPRDAKEIYEALIRGDPKQRSLRALYQSIYGRYISDAKKKKGGTCDG